MKIFLRQLALVICMALLVGVLLAATRIIDGEAFLVVVACNVFLGLVGMLLNKWFGVDARNNKL